MRGSRGLPAPCRPVLLLALFVLGGCQETLIFFEQTAFKFGISVNEEPPLPLEVTVGLKRRVVAIAPPKKPLEQDKPASEAVSLLSRFDVVYVPDGTSPGNPFGGTLRILSAFASGEAAVTLAGSAVGIASVVEPKRAPEIIAEQLAATAPASTSIRNPLSVEEQGLSRSDGEHIQRALCVDADGDFGQPGSKTRQAIQLFQASISSVPADRTGRLDKKDQVDRLLAAAPCTDPPHRNAYEKFEYGSEDSIRELQGRLGVPATGQWDEATRAAIMARTGGATDALTPDLDDQINT